MSRAARALILTLGIGAAATVGATSASATTPVPPSPPAATTVPGTIASPSTSTTISVVPPAGSRGGANDGSVVKPSDETWTWRRIATMSGLAVIALAAAGYAYGKLRSAPPRHPDLVRRPPTLDGADQVEATG